MNYNNEYNPKEQIYEKMAPNSANMNIPPENIDRLKQNQIIDQAPQEEIPPEYREMYMREQMKQENQL